MRKTREQHDKSQNDHNIQLYNLEKNINSMLPTSRPIDTQLLIDSITHHNQEIIPLLLKHPNVDPFIRYNHETRNTIIHNLVSTPGYEKEAAIFIQTIISHNYTYHELTSIPSLSSLPNAIFIQTIISHNYTYHELTSIPSLSSLPNDILREIADYTGSLINIENKNGNTPLDLCNVGSPLKQILKNAGAIYSKEVLCQKITTIFGQETIIDQNLLNKVALDGDIDAVWLLLCHPAITKIKLKGSWMTDFRDPMALANKYVRERTPDNKIARPGINIKAYCRNENCSKFNHWHWIDQSYIIEDSLYEDGMNASINGLDCLNISCKECSHKLELNGGGFRQCRGSAYLRILINPNHPPSHENTRGVSKKILAEDNVYYLKTKNINCSLQRFKLKERFM